MAETGAYHLYSSPGENMSQGTTHPWFSADLSHDNMCASGDLYLRAYRQLRNRMVTRTSLLRLYGRLGDRQDLSIDWDTFSFVIEGILVHFLAELRAHVSVRTMAGHVINT